MSERIEGPNPEKRLADLVQLATAFKAAQEAYDTQVYPNDDGGGYDDIADALECNLRGFLPSHGSSFIRAEDVGNYMMDCNANDVNMLAVRDGRVPTVFEHRVAVMSMHDRWPFSGPFDSSYHRLHPTWPNYVLSPHDRGFDCQTDDVMNRLAARVGRVKTAQHDRMLSELDSMGVVVQKSTVNVIPIISGSALDQAHG